MLCLTEVWVPEKALHTVNLTDYQLAAYYCRKVRKYGGVIIYCKKNFTIKQINILNDYSTEMHIEIAGIQIVLQKMQISVISVYRPPLGDTAISFTNLQALLTSLCTKKQTIVLCGDLNIDGLTRSMNNYLLKDLFENFGLNNVLVEPTRIMTNKNGATSISALDYMVTNVSPERFHATIFNPNLSDHLAQQISQC